MKTKTSVLRSELTYDALILLCLLHQQKQLGLHNFPKEPTYLLPHRTDQVTMFVMLDICMCFL